MRAFPVPGSAATDPGIVDEVAVTPPRRPVLWPLVVATLANYVWQVPCAVHQYGRHGFELPKLSIPLIATAGWFLFGLWLYAGRRRYGTAVLAGFLVAEAGFYAVHNASGALFADLPATNPVVLIASVLGYLNMLIAAGYLFVLAAYRRRDDRPCVR